MPSRPTALLVMSAGASRRAAQAALEAAGLDVRTADEPYAATMAFSERAADLVVLDLASTHARDRAFLVALRRRAPDTRILLLLSEGLRARALKALEAGAHAYVLNPFHAGELEAVARGLVRSASAPAGGSPTFRRLSAEVAHAINNPLQILSLATESTGARGSKTEPALSETVARIRDVTALLGAHGALRAPAREAIDLGRLLRLALESALARGRLTLSPPAPLDGVEAPADPAQLGEALSQILACLEARGEPGPLRLRARVRPARRSGAVHRLQILAVGLTLTALEIDSLLSAVVLSHDQTRRPYPGLALAAAVAHLHGGALRLAPTSRGLVVTLALPS